ncbi:hypothetical protein Tco_0248392 [Tanacetum coccineum]
MCDWVLSGLRLLVGLDLQALLGLDLVLNKVVNMISCTYESKLFALSWGWTPRLDSDVRVRKHVVRGESSTKVSKYFAYNRRGRSRTLVGQGSAVIVAVDADHFPRTLTSPLMACRSGLWAKALIVIVRPRPKGLLYLSYVIKSLQSSIFTTYGVLLRALSVIAAAKVSHFEILCRVHGYVLTVRLFRRFYVNSKNKGWMSFSKRLDTAPVCYTKPLDLLKHWNDSFFWVDASVFPLSVPLHTKKTVTRDPSPTTDEFSAEACDFLATHQAPFHKFSKLFLYLVGISRYYDLDDNVYPIFLTEMDLFAFIRHADPTKVRIGKRKIKVGATAAATVPFVTSSVTLTPEREGSGHTYSIPGPNLGTQHPAERFVISSNSSHRSSTNAEDAEVTSIVRSSVPPPPVLTAAVATTAIAGATSALVHESGIGPVHRSIFRDPASPNAAEADVAGPSQPAGAEVFVDTFYISQEMDSKALRQTYVPKWNMINDSAHDDPEVCQSMVDQLAPLRERKKFERKCNRQADLLKEKDVEIANLKDQLSLKKVEAAKVIRLRGQVTAVEVAEGARVNELDGFKAWNRVLEGEKSTLEGHVMTLESAASAKNAECASLSAQTAKLTQDLSDLQLLFDEQNEQYAAVHDEQVKILSDKVAGLDAELMGMALHLDEEFYPRFLTTIAGRRWILGCDLRLVVMKCLQSPEYLAALGEAIGRAINTGMHNRLEAGIDHRRDGWSVVVIAAYDPSVEAKYVFFVHALYGLDFPLLSQPESQKDVSIADIMSLLHLKGPAAETLEASQLQPSYEQLMLLIYWMEYNVVIGETSLSFSLDVVHARASTSGVPATADLTTALPTTFAQTGSVPSILVLDYEVLDVEPQTEAPSPASVVFEKEELETTP